MGQALFMNENFSFPLSCFKLCLVHKWQKTLNIYMGPKANEMVGNESSLEPISSQGNSQLTFTGRMVQSYLTQLLTQLVILLQSGFTCGWETTYCSVGLTLPQHSNPVENFLKCWFLGLRPRISDSVDREGPQSWISHTYPQVVVVLLGNTETLVLG